MRRSLKERTSLFRQFGGSLLGINGNSRERRPLSGSYGIHIVMRSHRARGSKSMRHKRHRHPVKTIVFKQAKKWGVRIYEYANVGNHLHILARPSSRQSYCGFIRSVTGLIARRVMKTERGRPQKAKFWETKPFSRVVPWGRAFRIARNYVKQNESEARSGLSREQIQILEEEFHRPPGATAEWLKEIYEDSA